MKRFLLLFTLVLVVALAGGAYWFLTWEAPPLRPDLNILPGSLIFADDFNNESYDLGEFIIHLETLPMPKITIAHRQRPDVPVWQSIAGENFLAAAQGTESVEESRGSFVIEDALGPVASAQRITGVHSDNQTLTLDGVLTDVTDTPLAWEVSFSAAGEGRLGVLASTSNSTFDRVFLRFTSQPDERFFGFGEQFTYAEMKSRLVPVFVSEQGIGRGEQPITKIVDIVAKSGGAWHTTYAAVPWFMTNRQRGFFLDNTEYSAFDLRDPKRVTVEVFSPTFRGNLIAGDSPKEMIVRYTEATGRMRKLPDWILEGSVVGLQGGTEKVRDIWESLRKNDVPLAGFWLQDWVGQRKTSAGKQLWWNWELDQERYPGWDQLVADLNAEGLEVMTYVNPFLADVSAKESARRHLYEEARDKGYLITGADGQPYDVTITSFDAGLVDLTNPEAYAWLQGIIRENLTGSGAKGWMADFGEALPYDVELHAGDAATFHNAYPVEWARLNREVIDALPDGDQYVFFCRSGFTRSPAHATLLWEGDQNVTWDEHDGIKSAVTGLLTGGMSGFTLNHSDIGGFTSFNRGPLRMVRSKELLMRWMELAAFTTVFRTHEGITPDANVQAYTDDETLAHFARCAKIYTAWTELRKNLVMEASVNGLPVVRHPFLLYPDDPEFLRMRYEEFFVGDTLLVAPVLDPGVAVKSVYLPPGRWRHVWSGDLHGSKESGTWIEVSAPLGEPPVFHREYDAAGDLFRANLVDAGVLDGPAPYVFRPGALDLSAPSRGTVPPISLSSQTLPPVGLN